MSELLRKEVEERNAKPAFFLQTAYKDVASISNNAIYQQARSTYNPENNSATSGMNIPVCYITEYVSEPKQILDIFLKGNMHDEILAALKIMHETAMLSDDRYVKSSVSDVHAKLIKKAEEI